MPFLEFILDGYNLLWWIQRANVHLRDWNICTCSYRFSFTIVKTDHSTEGSTNNRSNRHSQYVGKLQKLFDYFGSLSAIITEYENQIVQFFLLLDQMSGVHNGRFHTCISTIQRNHVKKPILQMHQPLANTMWSHLRDFFTQAADDIVSQSYPWYVATSDCPLILTVDVHENMSTFPIVLEGEDVWIDLGDGKGYRPVCTETGRNTNAQHEYMCKYDPYVLFMDDRMGDCERAENERDRWSCGWYPTRRRKYDIKIVGSLRTLEFDWKSLSNQFDHENQTMLLAIRWTALTSVSSTKEA